MTKENYQQKINQKLIIFLLVFLFFLFSLLRKTYFRVKGEINLYHREKKTMEVITRPSKSILFFVENNGG
jgi:preprotein translocase subunit YajC